jgi:hypothetical protein
MDSDGPAAATVRPEKTSFGRTDDAVGSERDVTASANGAELAHAQVRRWPAIGKFTNGDQPAVR